MVAFVCSLISCISYYSYIKPQRRTNITRRNRVVYRTIPTSNHNTKILTAISFCVVYRTIPTSNHNALLRKQILFLLYIVLFLHQTTTGKLHPHPPVGCISYYSYIKPQHKITLDKDIYVVYRTIPTSNHNL